MQLTAQLVLEGLEGESGLAKQHLDGVLAVQLCRLEDGEHEVVGLHSLALVLLGEEEGQMQPPLCLHAHGNLVGRGVGLGVGRL